MELIFDKALSSLYNNDTNSFNQAIAELNDLNYQNNEGRSLLIYAVLENNFEATKNLIKKGAKVNLSDNHGWPPLHFSINEHLKKITQLLIDNGADVNAQDSYGNNTIWRAVFASRGRGELIELLLKSGADPTIANNSGITALKLAETIGNYDVYQFFKNASG